MNPERDMWPKCLMRLDPRTRGMLGQWLSFLLIGREVEAPGCQPVTAGDKACTTGSKEERQKISFLANTERVWGQQRPCFLEATLSWIFFPVSAVKSILSDMPLKSALLAPSLNSLPRWSGSAAPNLGRQSSLAAQLALPEPRNQQSRHRQAHPRKIPTTQKRPLFPRRAGTRASPFVHFPPPC